MFSFDFVGFAQATPYLDQEWDVLVHALMGMMTIMSSFPCELLKIVTIMMLL